MKKIMLIAFVAVAVVCARQKVCAQITVDHVYVTDPPAHAFKLSSGLKYCAEHLQTSGMFTVTYFVLYNPDHSIFRTINVPQIIGKKARFISYVSDALFDLDTLIEYMLYYNDSINGTNRDVAVINENGNILLYVDSASFTSGSGNDPYMGYVDKPIFPDGNQTKLYLYTDWGDSNITTVYNLPGRLACIECDSGFVNGIVQPPGLLSEENKLHLFPNPNNGNATIEFKLPQGIREGEIVLYRIDGSEVKRYKVDGTFGNLILNNSGLSAGTYMYQLVAGNKSLDAKRMIVVH
jgi:hypothetical protein